MARNDRDMTEKLLEEYNDVFADIVNGLLFDGEQVVGENELVPATARSVYKADGKLHEQERDIAKYWSEGKVEIALLGLENQTSEDPDMTLRVASYDGAGYRAQLLRDPKDKKGRRIRRNPRYPVITLVLYYGQKPWEGARNLKGNIVLPDRLDSFVNDCRMNLFEIPFLTEEQVDHLHSDFRIVADFFVKSRKDPEYTGSADEIRHVDEVFKLMAALTKDRRFEMALTEKERRPVNMSGFLDRYIEKGYDDGLAQGASDKQKEIAIRLIHSDRMTDKEIAAACDITEMQVQELRAQEQTEA